MIDLNEMVRKNIIIIMNQKKITTRFIISKTKGCDDNIYKYLSGIRKISLKACSFFAEVLEIEIKDLFDEQLYNEFKNVFTLPYKNYANKIKNGRTVNERDNVIYFYRKISPVKKTLQTLADEFNISRERVRQIESKLQEQHDKL
jgi:hypothetical protein|tara:strand:+ start:58 stop:492 length:435 start_codon:yes stop_codon:yes gene_type:complete